MKGGMRREKYNDEDLLGINGLHDLSIGASPNYSFDLVAVRDVPAIEHRLHSTQKNRGHAF